MRVCRRCLYPESHPLHLQFDESGICSGCRVHEEKDQLDWRARKLKLRALCDSYRSETRGNYDCIIPVSGARDSYFIVHTVKKELGLNPLLVSYNRHYNTPVGHRNLAYLKTKFNCDAIEMVLCPQNVKKIARHTLQKIGSFHWHVLAGATVFPVQVAVRFKIPLIIWGHHQGLDQVGMFSHLDEVEMTRKYRKEHDLMGFEAEDLVSEGEGMSEALLAPYYYPHEKELAKVGVRGIYLGNFIRWDSKAQHEQMIRAYDYRSASLPNTFDTYNDIDCQHFSGAHDYIKYLKHGYGRVTDHACREIRLNRLSREEAQELVARYPARKPQNLPDLLSWLEMSEQEFDHALRPHVRASARNINAEMQNPAVAENYLNFVLTDNSDINEYEKSRGILRRGFTN